ncbi:hypothetical protein AALP_AAs45037U000100 [Arabis alpina]|uniref:DUF1204 domain-containing protein n=1 Tax=Arabis alpina TaxID=50452 RepID=A0A087FYJ1_ARAAL|nr:hypothetical protein AALP_AAs45037U000100 [Arabis alpina]
MFGSVSSNNSTKLVRRSGRPTSAADLDPQSIVRPDPVTDLIALSSCDEDSSDEESIDLPVQANLPDRENGAHSGDESDHLESEIEEEGEEKEIEGDEHDFEDERLHSPVRVDPRNPLGPGLGPGIELVRIDNMPTLSTIDTIRDMIRGRNLLISEEDILIPTAYDHPWTPPDGFLCLYEFFFNASALWFPLPKLLIEYCDRRMIAVSQLTHTAVRNIVTVLTLAAEIGRSCRTGFVLVLLRTKSITSLFLSGAENKTGRNSWKKELRGRLNLPLAPLRPFTLRIQKDRKPRLKKAKAQSGAMVKPERKVVKYTRTPMSGSVPKDLRQYDPSLDFADKPVYTLYAEELVRAVSHVSFMATRLEKTELRIVKLTSEVEALKGKLDRQVEISMEMTEEAENARGRLKEAGNRLGMLRDQLEHERNERDVEIQLLKEENEKLKAAGSDVVLRTVQTTIGKALSEMRISLNEEFDSLDVEVAKPEDSVVTPVADRVPLDLRSFQLDHGEGSCTRPAREGVPATEEARIAQDGENDQDEANAQEEGGEVDAVDATTNEEIAPLFPS